MSSNKFSPGPTDVLPAPAPYWYSDSEAFAYRVGYMEGLSQGRYDAFREAQEMRRRGE